MIFWALIVASFLLGLILGARTIVVGLAVLLAILAVTSSLPFQLGLQNLALVPVYLFGLVGAGLPSVLRRRDAQPRELRLSGKVPGHLFTWAALTMMAIFVASFLGIMRRHVTSARPGLAFDPSDLFVFAPPGLAGEIQTGFIAFIGPLLFVFALAALGKKDSRVVIRRAFTAGIVVALLGPVVQVIALTPWVRPDQRTYSGTAITGLVGFFQDPHSYAAYLVLSITFCLGLAIGYARRGDKKAATGYALLGTAAMGVLLYTNSRAGLISILLALMVLSLLTVSSPTMSRRARRWRAGLVVTILILALCATAVLASAPAREAAFGQLAKLGNARMWEVLRSDPLELLSGRVARLRKAWVLVQTNPLWGVGPNGFRMTPVTIPGVQPAVIAVHPHNYFVQLATEYGLPGAACFLVLVGMILACTVGGAYRAVSPIDRGLLAGVAAGQIGILIISLVSHPLLLTELLAVFWTLSALGVATALEATEHQFRSSKSRPTSVPKNGIGAGNTGAPPPA